MPTTTNETPAATGSIDVAASAQAVYALLTDLPAFAELAEETTRITWARGATHAEPGAVFRGANRHGRRRWTTTCTVTDAEAGRRFAFDVRHTGVPISRWQYDIEPAGGGCRVTETTWDRRPGWMKPLAGAFTGVPDRAAANGEHIVATLGRLKTAAEGHPGGR